MSLSMTLAVFGEVGLSLFLVGGIRVGMEWLISKVQARLVHDTYQYGFKMLTHVLDR